MTPTAPARRPRRTPPPFAALFTVALAWGCAGAEDPPAEPPGPRFESVQVSKSSANRAAVYFTAYLVPIEPGETEQDAARRRFGDRLTDDPVAFLRDIPTLDDTSRPAGPVAGTGVLNDEAGVRVAAVIAEPASVQTAAALGEPPGATLRVTGVGVIATDYFVQVARDNARDAQNAPGAPDVAAGCGATGVGGACFGAAGYDYCDVAGATPTLRRRTCAAGEACLERPDPDTGARQAFCVAAAPVEPDPAQPAAACGGVPDGGVCEGAGSLIYCDTFAEPPQVRRAACGAGETCVDGAAARCERAAAPADPPAPPPLPAACNDGCAYALDGACDDGRAGAASAFCAPGSDCTDCAGGGAAPSPAPPPPAEADDDPAIGVACRADGVDGTCERVARCGGVSRPGYCPGAADIQCCVEPGGAPPSADGVPAHGERCDAAGEPGVCQDTAQCAGDPVPGYCAGPAHIQCCLPTRPEPEPVKKCGPLTPVCVVGCAGGGGEAAVAAIGAAIVAGVVYITGQQHAVVVSRPSRVGSTAVSQPADPGDCDPDTHRRLQERVDYWCKNQGPRSCPGTENVPTLPCDQIQRNLSATSSCIEARRDINRHCYEGLGHPGANGERTENDTAIEENIRSIQQCQSQYFVACQ